MVGVPVSKGCALCLKRSIKCDETRPSCSQCRRGGRCCPGYEPRAMKFVDEGVKLRGRGRPDRWKLTQVKFGREHGLDRPPVSEIETPRDGHCREYQVNSASLERSQILSSFVSAMFPLGTSSVQTSFLGSWLWHVPPRLGCSPALDSAAMSLALAYFAGVTLDKQALWKAELSYSVALKNLAVALADKRKQSSPEVVCAALLLEHYETFVNANHAWIRHAGGMVRLMQLRGARRCYESTFEYSMFLACRGSAISQALASGKPCFLDAHEWRAIPDGLIEFPLLPQSSEQYHVIFGHFAAIPGFLSRAKQISNETSDCRHLYLTSRGCRIKQDIKQWYYEHISSDNRLGGPTIVHLPPDCDDFPFPHIYDYKDVISASLITTYYAYLIILNQELDRLGSQEQLHEENSELAQAICMSADCCLRGGYCGIQVLKFSLPIARSVLPVKHHRWIEGWLKKISDNSQMTLVQRLHP